MTYIERMKVQTSKAEMLLAAMLQTNEVVGWMKDITIMLEHTVPDFYFPEQKLCVYLDGPPHRSDRVTERDQKLTALLEKNHFKVLRFPYDRATVGWLESVFQEIILVLSERSKVQI